MRMLITGTSSGLGRALMHTFCGFPFRRQHVDDDVARWAVDGVDVIAHCAADARRELPATELAAYHQSNLELTTRLLDIPHRLFVFVSSQAVYPSDGQAWREDAPLRIDGQISIYGIYKLLAEHAVRSRAVNALILRCASLVGPEGRPNNIMRILRREPGTIFLSGACPYSLIAYSQVAAFIGEAYERGTVGTFNLGARDERTLSEIAGHVGASVTFGEHLYVAPRADLSLLHRTTRLFDLTTFDVADLVVRQCETTPAVS